MEWKRPLLIGVGWGIGTSVGLAAALVMFLWYQTRPKPPNPPKPWDTSSIKATYDYVGTEGNTNTIVVFYTLENTTDFDYRVEDAHNVTMTAKLEQQNSLSLFSDELSKIDYPIFVPAKKRIFFRVHIAYPYSVKEKPDANKDERTKYREGVAKYANDELSNLNGFELLDNVSRYDVIFPSGWKKSSTHAAN
jgi:hypothetical protein